METPDLVTALIYVGIVFVGGLVLSAIMKASDKSQEARSVAAGAYDIITGLIMLMVGLSNQKKYLSDEQEAFYFLMKLFGGLWIGLGVIQFVAAIAKNATDEEVEKQVNERIREQKQKEETKEALYADGWKCTCGRENAKYISTCVCGMQKRELQKQGPVQGISQTNSSAPVGSGAEARKTKKCLFCGEPMEEKQVFCGACGRRQD